MALAIDSKKKRPFNMKDNFRLDIVQRRAESTHHTAGRPQEATRGERSQRIILDPRGQQKPPNGDADQCAERKSLILHVEQLVERHAVQVRPVARIVDRPAFTNSDTGKAV